MKFDIAMAVVFAALAARTYKPRSRLRRLRYQDDEYEHDQYERERALAQQAAAYRPPPPVEPQDFTDGHLDELTRRMSAEDAETLNFFHALNKEGDDEPEPEEITDLRNASIYRGWRPTSDTASPTLTGTIVQEVPDEMTEAWGPRGPSASYDEWKAEGAECRPGELGWEEPDLLRDGVEVTMRKLALKHFGHMPELEQAN